MSRTSTITLTPILTQPKMATYLTMPADLPSHAEGFKPDDTVEHQVHSTAQHWLSSFEHAALNGDGEAFASLFAKNGFWRDIIAFTNDYRSIRTANIAKAANVSPAFPPH